MGSGNWILNLANWVLNFAALLLWLNWRSSRFDILAGTTPATLAGTLRRAESRPVRRGYLLLIILAVLFFRAVFYRMIGPAAAWTPNLQLGALAIAFRSDYFWRTVVFSVLSFGEMLALFYLWLLSLSLINANIPDSDQIQKPVRLNLGRVDRWPWPVKLALPLLASVLVWLVLSLLLARWGLVPQARSMGHRVEQGLAIGLFGCLTLKYLIGALLALHLINSYVYLGSHGFWTFIALTGRNLLTPLRRVPLHIGKVDFAPVIMIAAVFLVSEYAGRKLTLLYWRLPL